MDISLVKLLSLWMVAFCASQAWADKSTTWSQEDRDQILEIHNDKRDKEKACYMNKLVYDMDLERQAERWAKKCTFEHESVDNRGENLAMDGSRTNSNNPLIKKSTEMWYNEKNYYNYGQDFCDQSCHYTQMIWADTTNIGCYATQCGSFWYLVCFYTPSGNWYGEVPYTKSCESQCREGQVADDHLCVDEDTQAQEGEGKNNGREQGSHKNNRQEVNSSDEQEASSSEENGEENSEENNQENISNDSQSDNGGDNSQEEDSNEVNSEEESGEENTEENNQRNSNDDNEGDTDDQCVDEDEHCFMWASQGECENNHGWMTRHCRYACGVCDDSCVDLVPSCWLWASAGYCKDFLYGDYMRETCRYSCGVCDDPCVNTRYYCPLHADEEKCRNRLWTSNNCKASCGVCESRMPCQDYDINCPDMAEEGKCKTDPKFMLDKCRKSCEQC